MEQGDAELAGLQPDVLLLVLIGDVIAPFDARAARLPERHRLTGHVLQLDRDVLEDVPHPRSLVLPKAPDEPAGLAVGAAVLVKPRQRRDQPVDERRAEPGGGPLLERAEIELEPDDGEVGVQVGADVYGAVDDAHFESSTQPASEVA